MDVKVTLEGADRLARRLSQLQYPVQERAFDRAMFNTANTVLNESKKIVPVDFGTLRDSGRVEAPKRTKTSIEVEITYGGAAAPYALYVHEDPNARHAAGKTYKYLEIPVMAYQDKFVDSMLRRFATYLRQGMAKAAG